MNPAPTPPVSPLWVETIRAVGSVAAGVWPHVQWLYLLIILIVGLSL